MFFGVVIGVTNLGLHFGGCLRPMMRGLGAIITEIGVVYMIFWSGTEVLFSGG